jgi:hypothetical protein
LDLETQTIDGDKLKFEQYEWFVSYMLASLQLVVDTTRREASWRDVLILQVAYHWRYIEFFRNRKSFLMRYEPHIGDYLTRGIMMGKNEKF